MRYKSTYKSSVKEFDGPESGGKVLHSDFRMGQGVALNGYWRHGCGELAEEVRLPRHWNRVGAFALPVNSESLKRGGRRQ